MINELYKTINQMAGNISVKSAVNPALWFCVAISPFCFLLAALSGLEVFIWIGAAPVGLVFIAYLYFMFTKPEYLRSEEYNLKQQSLELLGDKDNPLGASASDVVSVTALEKGKPSKPMPQLPIKKETETKKNE